MTLSLLAGTCMLLSCTSTHTPSTSRRVVLLAQLEFAAFTVRTNLTQAAAAKLMHEKVKVGSAEDDAYEFLALPASSSANNNPTQPPGPPTIGQRIRVETVEQYLAALKQGAGSYTTFDIAMDSWFRSKAAALTFLSQADESRRSLLPANLLAQLPVSILGWNGSDQEQELINAAAKGITLRHYSRAGKLQKFRSTATTLKFEHSVRTYHLTELARGDFNHDGFEDSLVAVNWRYREGTGRGCEILLIQRVDKQPLKVTPFPLP